MQKVPAYQGAATIRGSHACNEWLRENGIDRDAWEWAADVQNVIALFPRALQPHADRVPASVRFIGPCLDPVRLADRSWAPPAEGDKRVLLVSLGTLFNGRLDVFRSCLEAFADSGWQVVMAVGKRVNPADLGPLPRNVEVLPSIPQLAVLASASAFITHAGMASCSEALWFGVPTVAIPQAVDQFRNASMLEELGVGWRQGLPGAVRHRSKAESGDFSEARSNSRYSSTISMIVD